MAKNIKTIFLLSFLFFFALLFPKEIKAVACPTTTGTSLRLNPGTVGTTSCAFAAQVDGVDNGTLEIGPNFTLTIGSGVSNQTIVFGTVKLNKPATIILNKGSALKKGYLFFKDEDGDGYADMTIKYYNNTSSYSNCNGKPCIRVSLAPTSPDCYDQNAEARPGQTEYFTVHRGDNSFDYNCNGSIEKKNTQLANCGFGQVPEKKFFAFKSLFEKIKKILSKNLLFNFVWAHLPPPPEPPPGPGGGSINDGWQNSVPDCGQDGTFIYWNYTDCSIASTTTYTQACR
jgi:hypothetical protein